MSINTVEYANQLLAENADLKKQVQALAAEIAQIKSAIESHAVGFVVCPVCSHEEPSGTDDVVVMVRDIDTPATDVILNEVRAQAVDDLATEFGQIAQKLKPNSVVYRAAKSAVFICVGAAARIRAGEVQP